MDVKEEDYDKNKYSIYQFIYILLNKVRYKLKYINLEFLEVKILNLETFNHLLS